MSATFKPIGKPFPELGKPHKPPAVETSRSQQVSYRIRGVISYERIKAAVDAAIASLTSEKRNRIPATATLPERMVALALVLLGYDFSVQASELGGRIRLGGGVVDFLVYQGASVVVIRVQGDYWHSGADIKQKDAVQWARLHRLRYRVADLWEQAIYQAWVDGGAGGLKRFVEKGVSEAV
jgi:hypothetical protein